MAGRQRGYVTGWCSSAPAGHRADEVQCWGGATGVVYDAARGRPAVVCHCPADCHTRAAAELATGAQLELAPLVTDGQSGLVPARVRARPEGVPV